jgi:hypothetical protein
MPSRHDLGTTSVLVRTNPLFHNRRPRRLFCYLPIIPRLQGFFQNPSKVEQLLYRHRYQHVPGTIADAFDGQNYRNLRKKKVVVDGEELPHCYFSGKNDISLSICTDSYLLFDRRRKGHNVSSMPAAAFRPAPKLALQLSA